MLQGYQVSAQKYDVTGVSTFSPKIWCYRGINFQPKNMMLQGYQLSAQKYDVTGVSTFSPKI